MSEPVTTIHWIDWTILGVYFCIIVAVGFWIARRQRSADDYYVGGRTMPGWAAGLSLFATSISTATFLAYPAHGFGGDWTRLVPGLMLPVVAIYLVSLVIPFYRSVVRVSAYEYLERRFGYPARVYAAVIYILTQLFRMGFVLFLMAKAIHTMTGWDLRTIIVVCGLATVVYTTLGGVRAVIWTDVLQSLILFGGGLGCLAILLFRPEGGPGHVLQIAYHAGKFKIADLSLDPTRASILVMMLYGLVQYGDNYSTHQTCVQRYLSVPSLRQARQGVWLGNLSCVLTWTLFLLIGTLLCSFYTIHPDQLPAEVAADQTKVFPYFMATQLPVGLVGLFLTAMCAAAMSSLDSAMNSLSLTTVKDLVLKWRPIVSERGQLILAKAVSCGWGLAGTCAALSMIRVEKALDFSITVFSILAGGMFGMFLLGFFARRAHAMGVYVGLVAGAAVSLWAATGELADAGLPLPAMLANVTFPFHVFLTAACSNAVSFGVGYLASRILPNRSQRDPAGLTVWTASR
ncbi:MAG: sodium:solute symporter [Pirellulales bacterium]|nr:sodium:solute symporter [Pirellulales bacterium]